jgi:hypothetical protein
MLINAIRGHAAEFGLTGRKRAERVKGRLDRVGEEPSGPALARAMSGVLAGQLEVLAARLAGLERES